MWADTAYVVVSHSYPHSQPEIGPSSMSIYPGNMLDDKVFATDKTVTTGRADKGKQNPSSINSGTSEEALEPPYQGLSDDTMDEFRKILSLSATEDGEPSQAFIRMVALVSTRFHEIFCLPNSLQEIFHAGLPDLLAGTITGTSFFSKYKVRPSSPSETCIKLTSGYPPSVERNR